VKLSSVLILSLLLLSNSLRFSFVYSWYALDIDSFIEELCENKDRPELQCNGTCYLSKMMTEKDDSTSNKLPIIEWEQQFFYIADEPMVMVEGITITFSSQNVYVCHYSGDHLSSIFHPPRYS
jgi:hypothetical protein